MIRQFYSHVTSRDDDFYCTNMFARTAWRSRTQFVSPPGPSSKLLQHRNMAPHNDDNKSVAGVDVPDHSHPRACRSSRLWLVSGQFSINRSSTSDQRFVQ